MRNQYRKILKDRFHSILVRTRTEQELTQSEMADKLAMDDRSYIDLDHGKSCCSATTLVLFLVYCCKDPVEFLKELRDAFEAGEEYAA